MNHIHQKSFLSRFAPILGAGAVGACPLCWVGSASLLTYLGLGSLIPVWRFLVLVLLGIGLVGFVFDFRAHRNSNPLILLLAGGVLLYLGRYVYGGAGFAGWPIWGPGALLVILAVIFNRSLFSQKYQHKL